MRKTKTCFKPGSQCAASGSAVIGDDENGIIPAQAGILQGFRGLRDPGFRRDLKGLKGDRPHFCAGERRVVEFFLAPLLRFGGESLRER
jgi:hypothetical protein